MLTSIQNDHLYISHFHSPGDGYTYLEEGDGWLSDGQLSGSSVIRNPDLPLEKKYSKINAQVRPYARLK